MTSQVSAFSSKQYYLKKTKTPQIVLTDSDAAWESFFADNSEFFSDRFEKYQRDGGNDSGETTGDQSGATVC